MRNSIGPQTDLADRIHAIKYRGENEDFREAMNRIAFGLKDNDRHYHELRDILLDQRFLPAGRIQSAIGATRQVTPFNCFVSGTIADSFVDGQGSIMQRAHEAAATMRMGGGIGYDFSTLRPKGSRIKRLGHNSQSSGPCGFMPIYNEICLATSSAGFRRGAQMGVLRVDHPDVEAFVRLKQNTDRLTGFNISIAVTDEFMEAVKLGKPFDLRFGGEVHNTIDAQALWEMIMRSTWDWGEPGVLFIDEIKRQNNLYYCEEIDATNPCSEQPLPPFGACLLGSVNLVKYLSRKSLMAPAGDAAGMYDFDLDRMVADAPTFVRALDNVTDRALYPLPEHKHEACGKRRIGIGTTGLANAAEACGHPYGSPLFIEFTKRVKGALTRACYMASVELAREKGSFNLFNADKYLDSGFMKQQDSELRDMIRRYGIRNSHLTSQAPTGTISITADNVSSGIEPVFAYEETRDINMPEGKIPYEISDYGYKFLGVRGKLAHQVTAREHINVLTTVQKFMDSAVSKTCNVDSNMEWKDFQGLYFAAWEGGAKGCTTFNKDGLRMGVRTSADDSGEVCTIDPKTGQRDCAA